MSLFRNLAPILLSLLLLAGCAGFNPRPMEEIPFMERAQTQSRGGITVTTAVPSPKEARQIFGVDLAVQRIQPVWLKIQNDTDLLVSVLLSATDPNYFSAHEAAYKSHFTLRPGTNRRMDVYFSELSLQPAVASGSANAGFLFTNLKLGTKEVRVKFFAPGRVETFEFYHPVPGFKADYHEVDWDALLAQEFVNYTDEDKFRAALAALPCCTTRVDGSGQGDPINLVVIGSDEEVGNTLSRAGWDETEKLTFASGWRTFKAFWGGTYKYSPMSSLYVYGRSQDAGFQKARDTIHERNHLRLWMSPMKLHGQHVWVGSITRDIGVYFTPRAWNLTTHAIDPWVDEAREYLAEDFGISQSLERFGYVVGVGAATRDEPHRNLMNAPWWTDGLRMVLEVSKEPRSLEKIRFFHWDWAVDEGETSEDINIQLRELGH